MNRGRRMRMIATASMWVSALIASGVYFRQNLAAKYGVCLPTLSPTEAQTKTVDFLNSIIELGLTLSTGLIGLSAALMLGLQGTIRLTKGVLHALCMSIFLLGQSVLYGFLWKLRVSNLWFNSCWENLDAAALQSVYSAHYYLLLCGLGCFSLLVIWVAVLRMRSGQEGV